jgi:4-diphosphocytidyl-2-C-methyl-D-erythritol kinase
VPAGFGNLMLSAAERYSALTLEPLPAIHVHLEKRIPIGAGLGGGSSDAATMLKILDRFAPSHASNEEMTALCETLGADVPFFYSGEAAALAKGIGERLTPISHSIDAAILIVKDPAVSVSTKEAYGQLRVTPQSKPADLRRAFLCANTLSEFQGLFRNDFEKTIFERNPSIAELKQEIYNTGASFALMSGSGASVFGLFEEKNVAERAKQIFLARGLQAFLS